ncbi:MAG: leucyl/phenylalanyl-tRNA--protein transferase [Prevotella sp.]|nr:leucyl/phenylalanyl-tRNA--protein transferase [Prevotella sp.]
MVWKLDDELWFPDPHWGDEDGDGLIAVGGDLSADRLLLAYSHGFFPWYAYHQGSEPHWYCPLNRFVIFPSEIHISHSMRQLIRQHKYQVTANQDFDGVIHGCSEAQGRNEEEGAWLGPDIIEAFTRLHHMGWAASIEVWESTDPPRPESGQRPDEASSEADNGRRRRLVGGLYGVTLRNAFFGESMFSLVPNASKLALIHLAKAMENIGGKFIDCQFETPLFKFMGGRHIHYDDYMKMLSP